MQFESSRNFVYRRFEISVNQLLPQWSSRTHCKSNWETCSSQYENCNPSIAVSLTGKFSVQNLWAPLNIAVKHISFLNYSYFVQGACKSSFLPSPPSKALKVLSTTSETQLYAYKIYSFFFREKKKTTIFSYCRFQEGSDLFRNVTDLGCMYTELGPDRHFISSNQNSDTANFLC